MFTKLLLCCGVAAILGIATESSADTYEVIQIDPQQSNQNQQNNPCQVYMNYYDNYYKQVYDQYYNQYYNNYWKNHYANQPQVPNVNLGNAKVEWVCTNPKTKDTMIISSEDVPVNNGQHYYPVPNYAPQQGGQYQPSPKQGEHHHAPPNYPPQQGGHHHHAPPNYQPPNHQHPPPNQPPQQQPEPSFSTDQPNYPQNPPHNYQENPQKAPEPQTDKPNTNGEGIIDIRFGDGD